MDLRFNAADSNLAEAADFARAGVPGTCTLSSPPREHRPQATGGNQQTELPCYRQFTITCSSVTALPGGGSYVVTTKR